MSGKRKHVTLTLDKKYTILKRLEKGEKLAHLSKEYNIGRATIHDIKKKKEQIESFFKRSSESSSKVRKTLKVGEFPQVEDALYNWFMQERSRHTPISGDIIMEKAKLFYNKIMKKDDFRASVGWLDKFKRRFGIRLLTMTGERLSCDVAAAEPFIEKFKEIVDEMDLGPDQIYNADESGLFWRLLPKQTFVHREEASAPGRKLAKDRLWPSLDLLEDYRRQSNPQTTVTTDAELNDLREAIAEQLVDDPEDLTSADVTAWLDGADDEQCQIMTDDEIIENVRRQ
ncbi:jerky protein homolog-like [Macrosteles quadrilineatus]|uniref:jerky protein homolog-like n=1 Tax=Macrosteles quadrilineatus TaxID=74068 RepID=UPI0023E34E49|nr:jerky protein homolog-like [Macrosteles quadrilineatus]